MDSVMRNLVFVLAAAICVVCLAPWLSTATYVGKTYESTFTVQAVEKSSRFGVHTNVWVLTYSGEDLVYKFKGHHDFELEKSYKVTWINEWGGLLNLSAWGRIQSKQEIEK